MADGKPDLDSGFMQLAHGVTEALYRARGIGETGMFVVLAVLRETWGRPGRPKTAPLSVAQLASMTGCARSTIADTVARLIRANVLTECPATFSAPRELGFQKYAGKWSLGNSGGVPAHRTVPTHRTVRDEPLDSTGPPDTPVPAHRTPTPSNSEPSSYLQRAKYDVNTVNTSPLPPSGEFLGSSIKAGCSSPDISPCLCGGDGEPPRPPAPSKPKPEVAIPEDLVAYAAELHEWLGYKRDRGQRYKGEKGLGALWSRARALGARLPAAIAWSMASNYAGIYEAPTNGNGNGRSRLREPESMPNMPPPLRPGELDPMVAETLREIERDRAERAAEATRRTA